MNKTAPQSHTQAQPGALSLELLLTIGLPLLSIAVCAVLAFVSYTQGYTEIAQAPTAVLSRH